MAGVMLGLIENLKNKYNMQVKYLHCDNASKNITFKKACKEGLLGVNFNILPQVCHNKMAASNENLLLSSTEYVQCSRAENSMIFYKIAYGFKSQTPPCFSKNISTISWEGKAKHPIFDGKIW